MRTRSSRPLVSLVIPNYDRADALAETLTSLAGQCLGPDHLEAILVDDGSRDPSLGLVQKTLSQLSLPMRVLQQEHQGPSAARNRGAAAASGDVLLFWDSDMIAEEQTVQSHLAVHREHRTALVAGARRPWEPACKSIFSSAMYLGRHGADQSEGREPSFQEMLSSNLSVRREDFWELGGFDESLWAFEDLDLAYRAQQAGFSLIFTRDAVGYHNHPMTFQQACAQQRHYARYAAAFLRKHPELDGQIWHLADKGPIRREKDRPGLIVRKMLRRAIAWPGVLQPLSALVSVMERHCPSPRLLRFLYWKILASYQLIGFREGLKQATQEAIA